MTPEARSRAVKLVQDYHDRVERYDVHHQRLESDDVLSMMRISMDARPRLIQGMEGVADGVEEPGRRVSNGSSGSELRFWDRQTLSSVLAQQDISVAVSPNGQAYSVQYAEHDQEEYFATPLTLKMTMDKFFQRIDDSNDTEVYQLKSQDGNVWDRFGDESDDPPELSKLQRYILRGPRVMQKLGQEPDAVNLWIGTNKSTTSLCKNQYDSFHQVLSGSQTFTLLSPIEGFLLDLKPYVTASYRRVLDGSLQLARDAEKPSVFCTTIDLNSWSPNLGQPLKPITITVQEGEWLYLPARWWLQIQHAEGDEGVCVAVNHLYDSPLRSDLYAMERFILDSLGLEELMTSDGDDDENLSVGGESWGSQSTSSWGQLNRRQ